MSKKIITRTHHISKTINAPLLFVYDWCTDYREDDNKITGSNWERTVLEKTKKRVIYTIRYKSGRKTRGRASIILLKPPDSWHLAALGDEDDIIGDYKLTTTGKNKTKLDMVFKVKYKEAAEIPTKVEWERDIGVYWDKYASALEKEYGNR